MVALYIGQQIRQPLAAGFILSLACRFQQPQPLERFRKVMIYLLIVAAKRCDEGFQCRNVQSGILPRLLCF